MRGLAFHLISGCDYLRQVRPLITKLPCFTNFSGHAYFSTGGGNFIQNLISKIKEESQKDKQLKESVRKFREETEKLEKSKEVQSMREFYKKIESEVYTDTLEKVKGQLETAAKKLKAESEILKKQEYVRKGLEGISRAGEQIAGVSRSLGKTEFVKSAKETLEALEKELQSDRALVYRAPDRPRSRAEVTGGSCERVIDADNESSGVVLHKDSKWIAAWENFKDNNQYVQKFFDLKTKYEESDHLLARSFRFITDKVTDLVGNKGSENDLQTVLEEVTKLDPNFTIEKFLRYCRLEVIPNVLESIVHGHLDVLRDWCYEASYNVLATPIKQTHELGFHLDSRILDVHNVDIAMGKMMEQGPVLIVTFQAQQIQCVRDARGEVREGDPARVMRVTHVWAMCRDPAELNPWMAWRLLDVAMMPTEQWV